MSKLGTVLVVALLSSSLAACSGGGEDDATAPGTAVTSMDPAANHVEALGGTEVPFGEVAEYDDGLTVVVERPEPVDPGEDADEDAARVSLTVRLVNGSDRKVRPAEVSVMVESGGGQASDVLDEEEGLTGPPAKALAPGARARWTQVFEVADPGDLSVLVQAGTDRIPVSFAKS